MQPDLENTKKKISENRDLVDRITAKLPGFKGYVEKAEMYDTDRIVRSLLGDHIQSCINDLNSISAALVKKDETGILSDIDALNLTCQRLQKKCRYADFGTTGSLSGVKLNDEDLNRLLEYDWRLISSLDEIDTAIETLGADDTADRNEPVGSIKKILKAFEKGFDERKNVLLEVI